MRNNKKIKYRSAACPEAPLSLPALSVVEGSKGLTKGRQNKHFGCDCVSHVSD